MDFFKEHAMFFSLIFECYILYLFVAQNTVILLMIKIIQYEMTYSNIHIFITYIKIYLLFVWELKTKQWDQFATVVWILVVQNPSVRDCHWSSLYFWLPHQQELSVGSKGANTPRQRAWKKHRSMCGLFRCSLHSPAGVATPCLDLPLFCEDRDFYFINSPNKFINSPQAYLCPHSQRGRRTP